MEYITFALAKGRLAKYSEDLLDRAGISCAVLKKDTRKLILNDESAKIRFIMVKAMDVPTYVEYGAADIGIVGKDTILEENRRLYEVIDLKFGKCKMVVAGPEYLLDNGKISVKRVATKYPEIAKSYFREKGETIEVIKLHGSVELAPLVGLSEVIVDIVETGRTLKENGLVVLSEICDISARLIVNRVSMKIKSDRIKDIIEKIKRCV